MNSPSDRRFPNRKFLQRPGEIFPANLFTFRISVAITTRHNYLCKAFAFQVLLSNTALSAEEFGSALSITTRFFNQCEAGVIFFYKHTENMLCKTFEKANGDTPPFLAPVLSRGSQTDASRGRMVTRRTGGGFSDFAEWFPLLVICGRAASPPGGVPNASARSGPAPRGLSVLGTPRRSQARGRDTWGPAEPWLKGRDPMSGAPAKGLGPGGRRFPETSPGSEVLIRAPHQPPYTLFPSPRVFFVNLSS